MKKFLATATLEELNFWCKENNFPSFRAKQIISFIREKQIIAPNEMFNLPLNVREKLELDFFAPSMKIERTLTTSDGVKKLLLTLHDGESVEMAIIPAQERVTFCLSTQVGCPVQCIFCASGKDGLVRNLSTAEIIEEFLIGCKEINRKCDNIVFMGIGEGLLNCDALFGALELLSSPIGFNFGARRITVSTSGISEGIRKLAALKKEYNLAVSLHAPDDETRKKLIPTPLRECVATLMDSVDFYSQMIGRIPTLEYTLIEGINDTPIHAHNLGKLAFKHHTKINLIPYNSTNSALKRPKKEVIEEFIHIVQSEHALITCRVERGSSKHAACGQLRRELKKR